ncbi:hypothetical protein THRCLA_06653 [Thraustotheca clavata]|uniref:EF-hand domain-containing protein n=1 Tax=Thraustotheca clavata TaxID=74557 RepID=A0A1V9ZLL7_9STRA|nr:hypothetical protein THRCLA_06653 [Thraustotheca clavata]
MSSYHGICVCVRSARGIPRHCRNVFLKVIYEVAGNKKKAVKSASTNVIGGIDGMYAVWQDLVVGVPTTSAKLTIELWNSCVEHDVFVGIVEIAITNEPKEIEIGPAWFAMHAVKYAGSATTNVFLEIVLTYIRTNHCLYDENAPSIADPSFHFRTPYLEIDWPRIADINLAKIFFMGDARDLDEFHDIVLYGNTLNALDMPIDKDHEKALLMLQYSSQYLTNCIAHLKEREAKYTSSQVLLLERLKALKHGNATKKQTLQKLRKQSADCDVLLAAYDAISKTLPTKEINNAKPTVVEKPIETITTHPIENINVNVNPEPSPEKKSAALTSYDERMERNRLAKEATRAERIESEKRRLIQIMADQAKQREWREELQQEDKALVYNSACKIQAWIRHVCFCKRFRSAKVARIAATTIQSKIRQCLAIATRKKLEKERQESRVKSEIQAIQQATIRIELEQKRQQVEKQLMEPVLVLWNDLQTTFQAAVQNGNDVFLFFDRYGTGTIDRSTFRSQLQRLGFTVPRQIIRRLIKLIHQKNSISSQHFTFTRAQFQQAFKLPEITIVSEAEEDEPPPPPPPLLIENTKDVNSDNLHEETDSVEYMSHVIQDIRQKIVSAAQQKFGDGKPVSFVAMRNALSSLFESLDVENHGELALSKFHECLETSFSLSIDKHVWNIIESCLDIDNNGSISIAEFVSFAFTSPETEELGVLGYKLRDAILALVKEARKDVESIEEAVKCVFHGIYKHDTDCVSISNFCKTLTKLGLGFTSAQLSRLVVRLDQDDDHTISFDELLRWLKLRRGPKPQTEATERRLSMSSMVVKQVRDAISDQANKVFNGNIRQLFNAIDNNQSGQISAMELHSFLNDHGDALPLSAITTAVNCIDVSGDGVISQNELEAFCKEQSNDAEEIGVLAEKCRQILVPMLQDLDSWFEELDTLGKGQVRIAELKKGLKKFVKMPEHDIDQVVHRLDADNSGFISYKEFKNWVSPLRDIEILLAIVEQASNLQAASLNDLFATIDSDGNGFIGIDEFYAGLNFYGLHLQREEAALLLNEFDINNDGLLDKEELKGILNSGDEDNGYDDDHGYDDDFD